MALERPQRADDVFNTILLEQADGGDASRSSLQARCGVLHRDAAESENRDLRLASFPQGGEARRLDSRSILFSEYRSKDGEVGGLSLGANHVLVRVAGEGHEKMVSGGTVGRSFQHLAHFMGCNVVGAEMDAVGSSGQRDISAGVN
jgi:hypothetical protein